MFGFYLIQKCDTIVLTRNGYQNISSYQLFEDFLR